MKIAILNDTHCGCRNSSEVFMDYQERFYGDVFFPYLLENNITQILHLGDYYDNRKTVNLKALSHNRRIFLDKLREYNIHMDIIPGNHDVYFKNTNELNSLKELMGHYMNEVDILMDPIVREYDGVKFGLVPWICPENEKEVMTFLDNCGADVIGGHFELAGFEMDKGLVCKEGMDPKPLQKFETVLSGHFHTKSSKGNIHYLGAQMEFFWNDAHDPKYFHIYDTETRELTPVQNNVTMFHKIYYDLHVLAATGLIDSKNRFHLMPVESIEPLAELFRHRFLATLLREKLISAKKARQLLGWKHSGFSLDAGEKPVAAHDVEGRRRLAEYLLRAPFSLELRTLCLRRRCP